MSHGEALYLQGPAGRRGAGPGEAGYQLQPAVHRQILGSEWFALWPIVFVFCSSLKIVFFYIGDMFIMSIYAKHHACTFILIHSCTLGSTQGKTYPHVGTNNSLWAFLNTLFLVHRRS